MAKFAGIRIWDQGFCGSLKSNHNEHYTDHFCSWIKRIGTMFSVGSLNDGAGFSLAGLVIFRTIVKSNFQPAPQTWWSWRAKLSVLEISVWDWCSLIFSMHYRPNLNFLMRSKSQIYSFRIIFSVFSWLQSFMWLNQTEYCQIRFGTYHKNFNVLEFCAYDVRAGFFSQGILRIIFKSYYFSINLSSWVLWR